MIRDLTTLAADLARYTSGVERARYAYATDTADHVPTRRDCADCHNTTVLQSRGLCSACYQRNRRAGTLDRFPRSK
ncbi:MAG: hypothetical protein ACXVXW_04900 [Mycobacteriaceae bacterium]